jgi:hypothetical protein
MHVEAAACKNTCAQEATQLECIPPQIRVAWSMPTASVHERSLVMMCSRLCSQDLVKAATAL